MNRTFLKGNKSTYCEASAASILGPFFRPIGQRWYFSKCFAKIYHTILTHSKNFSPHLLSSRESRLSLQIFIHEKEEKFTKVEHFILTFLSYERSKAKEKFFHSLQPLESDPQPEEGRSPQAKSCPPPPRKIFN